jgi:sugar/nucleoside kinase (ribokinase family)
MSRAFPGEGVSMFSVYSIENPLMDYLIHGDYPFLARIGSKPGTMQLVGYPQFKSIVDAAEACSIFPGGSGANTVRALAMLLGPELERYGRPAYSGGIGRDEAGEGFEGILHGLGIETAMARKPIPTGVTAIVITPDHERTMHTYLGACRDFAPEDVDFGILEASRFLYSTGYMWDTEPQKRALFSAVDRARAIGVPFCFDLADPFVVDRYYRELREWVRGRTSVIFANREELSRMTDRTGSDAEIVAAAEGLAPVVVMKTGNKGCIVLDGARAIEVPGFPVVATDTTGAGDSFAAGFLYGMLTGRSLAESGRLGNRIASRIVMVEGCRYDLLDREDILAILNINN